jgi:microcompartment protein CcmL/EutN
MQALGLIETKGLIAAIESADAMLKAADVKLIERTIVGGGLVSIVVTGDVGAVKAAVEAGGAAIRKINSTLLVSQHVIPRPHEDLDNIIISASPLKNGDRSTAESAKNESAEKKEFEIIEQEPKEVSIEPEEIVVEMVEEHIPVAPDLVEETMIVIVEEETAEMPVKADDTVVQHSEDTVSLIEKTTSSSQSDFNEPHNKETVDKMVLKQGLEETIEILSKLKVVKLRNLAREYKDFGIAGRKVSKADKSLLLTEFRKYYHTNENS